MTGRLAEQPSAVRAEQVERKTNVTRRGFLLGSGAVAAGMAFYSGEIARHEISVVTRPIAINNLPAAFQNFRIIQISDIHYEEYAEPSFVARVIGQVLSLIHI